MALANIDKELERQEKFRVIKKKKKNDYSSWVNPTVYVKKKNKIRLCVDYSIGLNDCLKQTNYPLPSADGIFVQ